MPDLEQISNMLLGQYNTNVARNFTSDATAKIGQQTNKRMRDLLSRFSTTGMMRSGISGVAANDIYSNAGDQINSAIATGQEMDLNNKNKVLGQMANIAQYQESQPTAWDFIGGLLGQAGGIALGTSLGPAGIIGSLLTNTK